MCYYKCVFQQGHEILFNLCLVGQICFDVIHKYYCNKYNLILYSIENVNGIAKPNT